jgi:PrsW family intramembrane metalloprotease
MGILIAAAFTTLAVLAFYGGIVVCRLSTRADRRALAVAVLVAMPLQPFVFYLVRMPLHNALVAALGPGGWIGVMSTFYAPLTEEPAKWLVLLVPLVRRTMQPATAVAFAIATGLGFGVGEIWFLAERLSHVPQIAALPFWAFGGFFMERFIVTFLHGGFIAFAFHRLATGHSFLLGGMIGVALHFAVNFPVFLLGINAFDLTPAVWQTISVLVMIGMAAGLVVALNRMTGGRMREGLLGYATCPECAADYPRPLIALNFGAWRYERCPNCRHWHMVRTHQRTKIEGKERIDVPHKTL